MGMKLALFDLDHTLIPFDSGLAWIRFLVARGALDRDAEERYLGHCRRYVECSLDIHAMLRSHLAPLGHLPAQTLHAWSLEFQATVADRLPPEMRALVRGHRDAGDLCALVTATERLIASAFARLFDIPHVVATEGEVRDGRYTGEIAGDPCFREFKVTRVQAWLETLDPPVAGLGAFEASSFYSDSFNDLPLLQAVSRPVAVRPDDRLRRHAAALGWPVL
jgi:HAD superfamily hydrolase (TIGR01490 family)